MSNIGAPGGGQGTGYGGQDSSAGQMTTPRYEASTNPRTKSVNYDSTGRYTGPMNKGGLMAKKKTKKK